jgi:ankyrin repeat protein
MVRLLLSVPGVDINASSQFGDTPISLAAEQGHEKAVWLLLGGSGVDVNASSQYFRTPLSRAAWHL